MFTLDLKVVKQKPLTAKDDVIVFVVRLDNGRSLPVYLSTPECLLSVMENIMDYRDVLKEYLYCAGYEYGSLKSVGYVE